MGVAISDLLGHFVLDSKTKQGVFVVMEEVISPGNFTPFLVVL
jgi:hypothetical protein